MYSFAQRTDCQVLDEPLFGYFLKETGVWRPSREEVLKTWPTKAQSILEGFSQKREKPLLMLKNMANHVEGLDLAVTLPFTNVILTRHPAKVLSSYTQKVNSPTALDLGYQHQLKIIEFLKAKGQAFWVVDSDAIIRESEKTLKRLCLFLAIHFEPSMLQWPAGPRPEDGPWAKYWYHGVHQSTGFSQSLKPINDYKIPTHLKDLYQRSLVAYQKIKTYEQVQFTRP